MRWTLALVPLLMLSGCLASSPDDPDRRTSDPASEGDGGDGLRKGVVFHEQDYQALPNEPLEFAAQVPEGARNVTVEMSVSGASTPLDEVLVTLSGCGQAVLSWSPGSNVVVSITVLGGSWREADLCSQADAGSRTVNLDTGATPMAGRFLLRADLPA
jgi:hypothetical protein